MGLERRNLGVNPLGVKFAPYMGIERSIEEVIAFRVKYEKMNVVNLTGGLMNYENLQVEDLKDKERDESSFTSEERKWASEAVADCYKRIENGTANKLKLKD